MRGGVRKRGKRWYYYFEDINDDGSRKKWRKLVETPDQRPKLLYEKFYQILTKQDSTFRYGYSSKTIP